MLVVEKLTRDPQKIRSLEQEKAMNFAHCATVTVAVISLELGLLSAVVVHAEPKTNLLSQWSEGSDAAAIAKLGEMYTAAGGRGRAPPLPRPPATPVAQLR